MATKGGQNIGDFARRICKDLDSKQFEKAFKRFLTKVDLPDGCENSGYKLKDAHPTYKYRRYCLSKIIDWKEDKGIKLKIDQLEEFITELENVANSPAEIESSFSLHEEQKKQPFDLFEQNIKLEGVVVRKCDKNLRASILTKKPDHASKQKFCLNELVINIQDAGKSGGGLQLKVGDIVALTECRIKEGKAIDAEVIKCFYRTESEMESFLEHLLDCLQSEGSTAVVTELTRCQAMWDYILKKCNSCMVPQILEIIDKICSSAQMQMSHTVRGIVKGLERSVFFKSVLPSFIHSITKENNKLVQRVLEHVMKVSPSCGPTLLPIATDLAHCLVPNSSDEKTAPEDLHTGCHYAIKFLAKLSSIIALEVPGAREDLKALPWRDLPLIPATDELHEARTWLKTDDLPVIEKKGNYPSEEEYLNTYFRLLREECFYKLRKGISEFLANKSQFDSKDMMMYRIVLKAVSTLHENSPSAMSIALKYTALDSKVDIELELSNCFLYGSLLCISMDDSFREPVWAMVENHVAEQGIVWITLCGDGANIINEAQFIIKMQEITDRNEEAFMAESQTFYLSFAPAMDVLQHKDCVPFKEFLVDTNAHLMKPAEYINEIKEQPDWKIIFKNENLPDRNNHEGESSDYSLLKEFEEIRLNDHCKSQLDETQLAAVELALTKKLTLIQGPPGTGKSFVGVALVRLLLSMNVPQDQGPILVITYKNLALDHFLEECLKNVPSHNMKIVRVGRLAEGASEELKKCLLREVGHHCWPEVLYKQKRKLTGQLWAMQPQVSEASRKLRESCIFSAETFLKEASKDQIKYLLVDNNHETVDGAEVEALLNKQAQDVRLKGLVENALKHWLPSQEEFDGFASKEKQPAKESRRVHLDTTGAATKSKKSIKPESEEEQEKPNDISDPAVEQTERLLAVDEERPDEEDEEIMRDEATLSQDRREKADELSTRKLVCIDETRVRLFRNLLDASKVWDLDPDERVQLAYVFQSSHREKACKEFLAVIQAYMQIHQQLKELRNQHDIEVMKKCHVIGMTVTGATMRANLLADIKPSVMIVEEAAEILEGQLVAVIPPSVQHLIMIGDHKQLKPMVHFQRLKRHHHFDLSMFERLINCKLPYKQLGFQCRMKDEFVELLRRLKIYPELKTNEDLVREYVRPQCVGKNMYFWTHHEEESESKNSHSKLNKAEAKKITEVAEKLCREGQVLPSKITVLCSYRGQVTEIRTRFLNSEVIELKDITVTTIDSFQGQENDIILISLVRSKGAKIGYLSSMNRLCVAISRARCGLYLFGNDFHLSKACQGWKIVRDFMRDNKCLGGTFPFKSESETENQSETAPGRVIVIQAKQANVIIGGDKSVNTINTTPVKNNESNIVEKTGNLPSAMSPAFPRSEKTPVHDPKSPTAERKSFGADVELVGEREFELTKEARTPTQATPETDKSSLSLSKFENVKERPTQESENAKSDITDTSVKDEEFMTSDKDARAPTQETPEAEKPSLTLSEFENVKEKPFQESENPEGSIADSPAVENEARKETPVQESEDQTGKKEELKDHPEGGIRHVFQEGDLKGFDIRDEPLQETEDPNNKGPKVEIEEQRDGREKKPFQETQRPSKPQGAETERAKQVKHGEGDLEVLSEGKPLQESASSNVETESWKEEALPTQETMAAGKGPFEETGEAQGPEAEKTRQVKEGEGDDERLSEGKIVQEGTKFDLETGSRKEQALSTQETMDAGKRPFQETGKAQGPDAEEARQIKEGEEIQEELTEGKPLQESVSSNVETESLKEEALPTQETMAAGKGPFEETGEAQGPEAEKTRKVLHEELTEGKLLQDGASSDVETESCKEEGLPTQETMAAGKGPFEETGVQVGLKRQPTDEQE